MTATPDNNPESQPAGTAPLPMARPVRSVFPQAMSSDWIHPMLVSPMLLPTHTRTIALLELLGVGSVMVLGLVLVGILISFLALEQNAHIEIFATLGWGGLGIVTILATHLITKTPLAGSGLTLRRWWLDILIGIPMTGITFGTMFIIMIALMLAFPNLQLVMEENQENLLEHLPDVGPWALLGVATLVATYEELIFRGFILPRVRVLTGHWLSAILLTSAVFALMHISGQVLLMVIPLFFTAILWSLLTLWRQSITAAVTTHLIFNYIQFLALFGYFDRFANQLLNK